jgi:hypothetical protein
MLGPTMKLGLQSERAASIRSDNGAEQTYYLCYRNGEWDS